MEISLKNFKIVDCIHGKMAFLISDKVIGICLSNYGEWSEGENIIMSQFIKEGDTVIDIGANIGTTVLALSKKVSTNGKVIAFEPQNNMSQCLQTSLTLNDIKNVDVYNMAVSNKSGWANINDEEFEKTGRYGEAGIAKEGTRIKTIKLDELKLDKCNLVKIDVESHEWEVIEGGKKFLLNHKPVLYMEAKMDVEGTKKYLKWLLENGWRCYWHYAFWYRNNNYKKNNDISILNNVGVGVGDMNIAAIPNEMNQPNNLLELKDFDEKWNEKELTEFYNKNNLQMI